MIERELQHEYRSRANASGLTVSVIGSGNPSSAIAIVGDCPGERECSLKTPFVGGGGQHLWNTLRNHGIVRSSVYCTHVVKRHLALGIKDRAALAQSELDHWVGLLKWELQQLPNLKHVLVLGKIALKALLGEDGVTKWRGSVIEKDGIHYTVTYNPSEVIREAKWEVIFAADLGKFDLVVRDKYKPHDIEAIINPSFNEAMSWMDMLQDQPELPIAGDYEVINQETACLGLANNNHKGMCIAFRNRTENVYSLDEEMKLRLRIQKLASDGRLKFIWQNGSFDMGWSWFKDRILWKPAWVDTMLAHHCLYPLMPHNLGFLTSQYTMHPYYKDDKDSWKEGGDIDTFWEYNVKDCCITRTVAGKIVHELEQQHLDKFFFEHIMRLQPHLVRMQVLGVRVDEGLKAKIIDACSDDVLVKLHEFHDAVAIATGDQDYRPNPQSTKQMVELYFNRLRLVGRGTSTDADNRQRMSSHPRTSEEARRVLATHSAFSKEAKFTSTYAEMEIDQDGRVRCEYKQTGTQKAPGRLSSSSVLWGTGANLQNQPERAKVMFIADPGYRLVYFDMAQAEARIVAYIWKVKGLIENFKLSKEKGIDVHRANGSRIFKVPYEDIPAVDFDDDLKPTRRYLGKRCVHGLNYRMQPPRLADTCNIPVPQAISAYRQYHEAFPEIKKGWDATIETVYATKELWSPMGRRMKFLGRLPARTAEHGSQEAAMLDSIIAFKPQSAIGDKVCQVIYQTHDDPEWPDDARIILNVHDALIALVPDNDEIAIQAAKVMKRYAESPIYIDGEPVEIPADFKWSTPDATGAHRWSKLDKFKLEA